MTPGSIVGMLALFVPGTVTGNAPPVLSVVAVKRTTSAPVGHVARQQEGKAWPPR